MKLSHYDIIRSPVITEKSTAATEQDKVIFNVAEPVTQQATGPAVSATGQLAYAIRDGQHWSVWTHNLATGQNAVAAKRPTSDGLTERPFSAQSVCSM